LAENMPNIFEGGAARGEKSKDSTIICALQESGFRYRFRSQQAIITGKRSW